MVASGSGQCPNADFFFPQRTKIPLAAWPKRKKKQLGVGLEVLKATELCVRARLKG